MNINENSWHARVYNFGLRNNVYMDRSPINLCQYLRSIFLWVPLWFGMLLAIAGILIFLLIVIPIIKMGLLGLLVVWVGIPLALLCGIGVPYVIEGNSEGIANFAKGTLVGKYYVAKKQRFCPMVDFK